MHMSNKDLVTLPVQSVEGQLVVDSRLVAEQLGIEHESFIRTVDKYQAQIEQAFGVLRFEIGKPSKGSQGGRPQKYVLLTENQATFIMTVSQNTPQVVATKLGLVVAFSRAKELIASATPIAAIKSDPFWDLIDGAAQRGIEPERAIDLHHRMNGTTKSPAPAPKSSASTYPKPPKVAVEVDVADFIAKVQSLIDEGLLDERHVVKVVRRRSSGRKWLAIHGATVWIAVMARYNLPYNRCDLERAIAQGGGFVEQQTQKFRHSITDKIKSVSRKCWLLPL